MKYSIIVPVFNRPDEVDELLESLCHQEVNNFEVIIVEDGSKKPCKDVCDKYAGILDLHYYLKTDRRNHARMSATSTQASLICIITIRRTVALARVATMVQSVPTAIGSLYLTPTWSFPMDT